MLIDFENTGYITICENPEIVPIEERNRYIPSSTWGFIRGDIKEQSDLISLLTTIESGLTPEQIKLLVDTDSRFEDVEKSVIELDAKNTNEYVEINLMLDTKANADSVYTKTEIDNKGYLTEHQSLAGYATEKWVYQQGYISTETDPVWLSEKHKYALKTDLPSVAGLASENWVNDQLTLKANADSVYTKLEVDSAISNVEVDLTGYATENWVKEQNYLTEHQSLTDYYTKSEIDNKGYLTEHQSLTDYYTKSEIDNKGYLTQHQSLTDYYTKTEVDTAISNVEVDLTGYATETWVKEQGYLTEHQSLTGYATESWVNGGLLLKANISDVYTKTEIDNKGYLTQHQSLDNYYTKGEVDTAISNVEVDLTGYATETYVNTAISTKVDTNQIWTGTQSEWDALSTEQQNSYIIAMIEL